MKTFQEETVSNAFCGGATKDSKLADPYSFLYILQFFDSQLFQLNC